MITLIFKPGIIHVMARQVKPAPYAWHFPCPSKAHYDSALQFCLENSNRCLTLRLGDMVVSTMSGKTWHKVFHKFLGCEKTAGVLDKAGWLAAESMLADSR